MCEIQNSNKPDRSPSKCHSGGARGTIITRSNGGAPVGFDPASGDGGLRVLGLDPMELRWVRSPIRMKQ